jgi:hypothetical protein
MLLERIVHSLSQDELLRVRNELHLPGRSRQLFDRIALASTPVNTEDLCETFQLSKNNLYRLCSEMLDGCLSLLSPAHEFPKLEFLRLKFLYEPFAAELKRTEQRLLSERSENLASFYKYGFESLGRFPINCMEFDLIEYYARKCHQTAIDPPVDHELCLEAHIVFLRIGALPRNKKMTVKKMDQHARAYLETIADRCEASNNPLVKYYYYQAQWKAITYSNIRRPERISSLERSLEIIKANESLFPDGTIQVTLRQIAYEKAILGIGTKQAFELFSASDQGFQPNTSRNGLFLIRFVRIALMVKQFEVARRLLDRAFAYPSIRTAGLFQPFLMLRAITNIVEGKMETVESDLAIVRAMNTDEQFFLPHEMGVRALETVLALKRGDLITADLLVTRNFKWMQKRRYALEQSPWPYYYQTIRASIAFRQTGERPRPALSQHFDEFRLYEGLYALLLEEEAAALFSVKESINPIPAAKYISSKDRLANNTIYPKKSNLPVPVLSVTAR